MANNVGLTLSTTFFTLARQVVPFTRSPRRRVLYEEKSEISSTDKSASRIRILKVVLMTAITLSRSTCLARKIFSVSFIYLFSNFCVTTDAAGEPKDLFFAVQSESDCLFSISSSFEAYIF